MTAIGKIPLSVVIIAQNEEDHIVACLESAACASECVVVDGGSSDRTVELAQKAGAKVVERPFDGFISQKNAAIDAASFHWVLSLDADERLSPDLVASIRTLFADGAEPPMAGYFMPRISFHLGRWIRHGGWYPDRKLRLLDRRRGRWAGRKVHEKIQLEGESGVLEGDLIHYPYRDYQHHLTKMDSYTTLASELLYEQGRKWPRLRMFVQPPLQFLKSYLLRRGFLDGAAGFTLARLSARYEWLRYSKLARLYAGGKA
ncbi:MAG: glycosyltransferase family 2 protein [Planctomycetota bacterium]|jgi:glycosyltransferase involved in cell wall biosynthesis|nr:glycosyltransferase family 2 protein [Planctomycetota bacterium]